MIENVSETDKENYLKDSQSGSNELQELAPKVSIQEAFKKFQKQKFYQLKLNKYLKNVEVDRTTPEFKQKLREKFIDTAKKYMGVPYAQKYHQPGDPLYQAPLFLDCCALIRQTVFDLRQEFGYTLAKWNQAYQFDLLPDEGLEEKDLKPGDLIFYSGIYTNPKLKPFPHGMVHVEIYMGEGRSIGARWQKGTVQIFDSYKFKSNLYHDIEFHYRSIDCWLEGRFQSHCKEHKWLDSRNNEWLSDKYSVFADPSLDDMELTRNDAKDLGKVMVGKGNNSKLVEQFFRQRDDRFSLMDDKEQFSTHYYYKWVQSSGEVDFYSFKEGCQLVNHIPNICIISSKTELMKTLKDFELCARQDSDKQGYPVSLTMSQYFPQTYRLDVMSDEISFLNDENEDLWIYKPRNLNQGRGIRMIADIKQFKREFINSKKFYLGEFSLNNMLHYKPDLLEQVSKEQEQGRYHELKHDGLIQHYIRPLLISNRKFDIRCYMLISNKPNIVLFHEGYLRLTLEKYSEEDIENQEKLMIHLTNNCYQHKHKDYKQKKESTIGTWDLLTEQIGPLSTGHIRKQIKRVLLTVYCAAAKKLISKRGTYELLGCDFVISCNKQPYLLEVNTNPAMFTDTQVQKQLIPTLTHNVLDLELKLFEEAGFGEKLTAEHVAATYDKFELLFNEELDYFYNLSEENCQVESIDEQKSKIKASINGLHGQFDISNEIQEKGKAAVLERLRKKLDQPT